METIITSIGVCITLIGCVLMAIGFTSISRGCGARNAWLILPGMFIGVCGVILVFFGMR